MFVKNLPGQTRHCGILPSHEQSLNPDKDTGVRGEREREETNDREEDVVIVSPWPCATTINT